VLLPEARRRDRLAGLIPLEPEGDGIRRLAALLVSEKGSVDAVAARLRLPNVVRDRLALLAAPPWPIELGADERGQRRALHHLGLDAYRDLVLLRAAETGAGDTARALLAAAPGRVPPRFPLRGSDVTRLGVPPGPAVGELLAAIKEWWEAGDFRADRKACLARLGEIARAQGAKPL
jgi:poly(A) polymerase